MPYSSRLTPAAERQLRKLESSVQRDVVIAIKALEENPRPEGSRKLKGEWEGLYRIDVGPKRNHCIIYAIRDRDLIIIVVKIGDRRDVYR